MEDCSVWRWLAIIIAVLLISSFLFRVWLFSWEATPTSRKFSRGKDDLEYLNLSVSGYALGLELAAVLGLVAGLFFTGQQLRATSDDLQTAQLDLAFSAMQTVGDQQATRQALFAQASQHLSQADNSRAQIEGLYILAGIGPSALSTAATCAFLLDQNQYGEERERLLAEAGVAAIMDFEQARDRIVNHLRDSAGAAPLDASDQPPSEDEHAVIRVALELLSQQNWWGYQVIGEESKFYAKVGRDDINTRHLWESYDLSGLDLRGVDLRNIVLIGVNISDSNLSGAILKGDEPWQSADLRKAALRDTTFAEKDDFSAVCLDDADLSGSNVVTKQLMQAITLSPEAVSIIEDELDIHTWDEEIVERVNENVLTDDLTLADVPFEGDTYGSLMAEYGPEEVQNPAERCL